MKKLIVLAVLGLTGCHLPPMNPEQRAAFGQYIHELNENNRAQMRARSENNAAMMQALRPRPYPSMHCTSDLIGGYNCN